MDISLIFLPLFITFLLLTDFKNPVNGWGSMVLLFISLGGLYSAADSFSAGIVRKLVAPDLIRWLNNLVVIIFVKTPLSLFPIALLMFTFYYSRWNPNRARPLKPSLIPVLLMPAIIMYFIPLNPKDYSSLRQFLIITDLWIFPYIAMAYCLLYKSVIYGNPRFETDRLLTIITIVIISAIYVIAVYLLPFYHFPIFKLNLYLVITFLGLFSFLAMKYGFLGFKLTVGNVYLDNAIKTMDSEVSVLNYHIKNKLLQIMDYARQIGVAAEEDRDLVVEKGKAILGVTVQISKVAQQLHRYLDKIVLNPTELNMAELVKEAITSFRSQLQEKGIRVVNNLHQGDIIIRGDRFYLVEALKNILQNSLEAVATGDSIKIDVARCKRKVTLIIADTGCGISPEALPHILKPFYTTKDPGGHFGLGLSYCYNIMLQHCGRLEIESTENKGTTVLLKFPVNNISL